MDYLVTMIADRLGRRNLNLHLNPLPRRYGISPRINTIGWVPAKRDRVHRTFATFNLSFILRGQGEYRIGELQRQVTAPCVIIQWPGVFMDYGPRESWDEFFITYGANQLPALQRAGLADRDRPTWPIVNPTDLIDTLAKLMQLASRPGAAQRIDQADQLAGLAALQSLQDEPPGRDGEPADHTIQAIRDQLDTRPARQVDFDSLAGWFGMSPATFRRAWRRQVDCPPGEYLTRRRMQLACRLLVETPDPIGQIAGRCGYDDPLYFSRRFRQRVGVSPRVYRRENRPAGTGE